MTVVRFDHLDVRVIPHHPSRHIQQLEAKVYTHAVVRRKDDGNVLGRLGEQRFFFFREPGRANHHRLARLTADLQVDQRGCRVREVDQHIKVVDHLRQVTTDRNAKATDAGQLTRVSADQGTLGALNRCGQRSTFNLANRLDQDLAHAPGCTYYRNTSHAALLPQNFMSSKKFFTPSNQLLARGDWLEPSSSRVWRSSSSSSR